MTTTKLWAATFSKAQLDKPKEEFDVVEAAMEAAMARIGWECISCPHEAFQWIGNELEENDEGGLNVYIKIVRENKENSEYDSRTKEVK